MKEFEDDERTMELFENWSEFIVLIVLSVLCPPAALFRVQGSGFGVQGSGFRVRGSGFRVQGSGLTITGPDRL
jgi:hypothetical protein